MRKYHGSRVGERAQAVWVCDRCGTWQIDIRTKLPLVKPQLGYYCMSHNCTGTTYTYFASKAEAKAYASLLLRVAAGEIADLELQPRYPLHATTPSGGRELVWTYVADFRFRDIKTGALVVIDAKGDADTHISAAKRKHAEAEYGITIRIMSP
jgi:hypothetical protein